MQEHVGQEQERRDAPERESPGPTEDRAQHDHGREGDGVEDRRHRPEGGRAEVGEDLRLVALADRVFDLVVRLLVQPVRADHRRAHHGLGHLREHLAYPGSCRVERGGEPRLHRPHDDQQGDQQQRDRRRELPRVIEHQQQRADRLGAGDDPRDPAPLHELLERVHIGRHARHEYAALLLALLGDR